MKRGVTAGALAAVLLLAACGGDDDETPSLAAWAAAACGIASDFQAAVTVAGGGVTDPTTLPLDERLARAQRLGEVWVEESERAADALREFGAADGVGAYHSTLIRRFEDFAEAYRVRTTRAASAEELEEQNAELNIVLERGASEVSEVVERLPDDAVAALRGVNNCVLLS